MKATFCFNFDRFHCSEPMTWQNSSFCPSRVCIAEMSDGAFCSFPFWFGFGDPFPSCWLAKTERAVAPLSFSTPCLGSVSLLPSAVSTERDCSCLPAGKCTTILFYPPGGYLLLGNTNIWQCLIIKHSPWFIWEIIERFKDIFLCYLGEA